MTDGIAFPLRNEGDRIIDVNGNLIAVARTAALANELVKYANATALL